MFSVPKLNHWFRGEGRVYYGKNGYSKIEEIPDPNDDPGVLPYNLYSALMGLLMSSGASLQPGPYNWWFPESTVLRLNSTSKEFLEWLIQYFHP